MGVRTVSAVSEDDRRLSRHLEMAIRELETAADLVRKSAGPSVSRTLGVHRDLRRYIHGLRNLESIMPKRSLSEDPDAMSEEELAKRAREKRLQRKSSRELKVGSSK